MMIYDPHFVNDLATIPAFLVIVLTTANSLVYIIGSKGAWHTELLGIAYALLLVSPVPVLVFVLSKRLAQVFGIPNGEYGGYELVAWGVYLLTIVIHSIALTATLVEQRRGRHVPPGRSDLPET